MKKSIFVLIGTLILISCGGHAPVSSLKGDADLGTSYKDVWAQVTSDPYESLPSYGVTFSSIGGFFGSKAREAARATLSSDSDFRPAVQKVVHPNGICLSGVWSITADSPYTGLFTKGTSGLIIARASAATSSTQRGSRRAFGFAGKIFPTLTATTPVKTANFFTVDDLGGTNAEHYTDVEMTNQPKTSTPPLSEIGIGLILLKAFGAIDPNATKRQLYPLSESGLADPSTAQTPNWMKISARPGQQTAEDADFRTELHNAMLNNSGKLVFDIAVAGPGSEPEWRTIGAIELGESIASESCDKSLHFPHPRWRTDLQEP